MSAGTIASWYCTFSRGGWVGAASRSAGLAASRAGFACFACLGCLAPGFASWEGLPFGLADFGSLVAMCGLGPGSNVHDFAVGLEEAHLARGIARLRLEELEADAVALAGGGIDQHHVRAVERHLLLDDAAGLALHGVGPLVLLHAVDTLDHYLGLEDAQHRAALALVLAGGDDHQVALADLLHRWLLQHFRRERHDLHEALGAQLARDRPEDARADRLELGIEQHGGVGVELDHRAVGAAHAMGRAHHHRAVDLALLHAAARGSALDADLDDVADARVAALGAAEHLDTHHRARAGVVGDVQNGLHLNHGSLSNLARRWNRPASLGSVFRRAASPEREGFAAGPGVPGGEPAGRVEMQPLFCPGVWHCRLRLAAGQPP